MSTNANMKNSRFLAKTAIDSSQPTSMASAIHSDKINVQDDADTGQTPTVSPSPRNMWDEEFNTDRYVHGTEPNDFLQSKFSTIPKGKVLCLADGEGRNSVFLAKQGYTVTAVDISPVAQHKGQKLARENNVNIDFVCADLADYELGERYWDGVVSIFCHLPPDIRRALYKKIMRALKFDGVFLLEGYTPDQLRYGTGGPPVAEMMTTNETLERELPGMHFEHLAELERSVVEGINHN